VLTPSECLGLFGVMRALKADGRVVLFVTHKLQEVMSVSDRVTVMRDGRVTERLETAQTSPAAITRAMTGRDLLPSVRSGSHTLGPVLLAVQDLTVEGTGRSLLVDHASFELCGGEILGVAGVAGNGQAELVEAICGLRPGGGSVKLMGRDLSRAGVAERRAAGLSYIPEDRARTGTALAASVSDNLVYGRHHLPPFSRGGWLRPPQLRAHARELISRYAIKVTGESTPAASLSGGNLQKVVIARELEARSPVLIAEQPTRGVDIGATQFIHRQLLGERERGAAVLLVSAELSELLALCDRILVMFENRIVAEVAASNATEQQLGSWMAGLSPDQAAS
ncbi:MAG: ABC transporter ATP-binding protein, partial [Deinococcus sp.]